jgi:hypothetical protein
MKRVTKKELNDQLRGVFGRGAFVQAQGPVCLLVRFETRKGESLEDLKRRLLERLDQLPGADT